MHVVQRQGVFATLKETLPCQVWPMMSCISLDWSSTSARLEHNRNAQKVTEAPSKDVSDHNTVSAVGAGWYVSGFTISLKSLVGAAIQL